MHFRSNTDSDKKPGETAEQRLQSGNNGVIYEDNSQCQFNPKDFKVLYVIKSENCFYRRLALRRAKKVSCVPSINGLKDPLGQQNSFMYLTLQSGASYLSQGFVMFSM